jgi:hypothetical protein
MAERQLGQASVELLAAMPALVFTGLLALQLLVAGYTSTLADGAVEAAAAALVAGRDPQPAVDSALPGWERDRASLTVDGSHLTLTLRPPSPIGFLAGALEISSSAWVRLPSEG